MTVSDSAKPSARRVAELRAQIRVHCPPDDGRSGWVVHYDSIAVAPLTLAADPEGLWRALQAEGIERLPPKVPRTSSMLDGFTWVLELRRGQEHRVSQIEAVDRPEHPADTAMARIARTLGSLSALAVGCLRLGCNVPLGCCNRPRVLAGPAPRG